MKIKVLFIAIVSLMMFSVDAYSQCKGKCRNGKGIYTFEDGEVYDGQFVDGQFEGKGTYSYIPAQNTLESSRLENATARVLMYILQVIFIQVTL